MLNKAEGIVLRHVKYSDSGRILTVYTREKGKKAYFLSGVGGGKKKSGHILAAIQPLSLVEMLVSEPRGERGMGRVREIRISTPTIGIRENIVKTSIVLFLNEVIHKSIREEEKNEPLFDFIKGAILSLDRMERQAQNFHLHFLIHLTAYLGIHLPVEESREGHYFDLTEGIFVPENPAHGHVMDPQTGAVFRRLMASDFQQSFPMSREERNRILQGLLTYYRLHLHDFGEVKSHHILSQVLS